MDTEVIVIVPIRVKVPPHILEGADKMIEYLIEQGSIERLKDYNYLVHFDKLVTCGLRAMCNLQPDENIMDYYNLYLSCFLRDREDADEIAKLSMVECYKIRRDTFSESAKEYERVYNSYLELRDVFVKASYIYLTKRGL